MKRTSLGLCVCIVSLLAACGGDGGGNGGNSDAGTPGADSGTSGPKTVTVTGKVLDSKKQPAANVAVLILGKSTVTTDASGAFSVSGVTTPYDLAVVNGARQSAVVYQGVTRQDPTVAMPADSTALPFTAKVAGAVTGALKQSSTVAAPEVVFVSPETSSSPAKYDDATSTYSLDVSWGGPPNTTGTLFAFQGERTSAAASYTKFTSFGRRDNVSLSNGATVSNQGVVLNTVANSTLAGTVTAPKDFSFLVNSVSLELPSSVQVPLFSNVLPAASFSYAVPVVAQSTLRFTSITTSSDRQSVSFGIKTGVAAGTNNVSMTLKPPSSPILPLNSATQVTRSTEFSWSALADGIHVISFTNTSANGGPYNVNVFTGASRTTLPDLSALGMGVPANATLRWQIQDISPIASVDVFVAGTDASGTPAGLTEIYFASAASRSVTVSSAP